MRCAYSAAEANEAAMDAPDVVLLDLHLREVEDESPSGIALLERFHSTLPETAVVVLTGHGNVSLAVECMRRGASDFIEKGGQLQEIIARINAARDRTVLTRRVRFLERELDAIHPRELVGESEVIREFKRALRLLAVDGRETVLIEGETGSGKELAARFIHLVGPRHNGPFVPVVIAALPESLIESELFGHEKAAFTEARNRRVGYLEEAHRGVLLLDEIGDTPLSLQVKILRFLEEREIRRLGGVKPVRVDVQVIATTNRNMQGLVEQGRLREDLYYRLSGHILRVPPLRERRDDIPILVEHYVNRLRQQGRVVRPFAPEAMRVLQRYPWPGNVRQLGNVVASSGMRALMANRVEVQSSDLPPEILTAAPGRTGDESGLNVARALALAEFSLIQTALRHSGGRRVEAARLLGYGDRFTLRRRLLRIMRRFPDLSEGYESFCQNEDAD